MRNDLLYKVFPSSEIMRPAEKSATNSLHKIMSGVLLCGQLLGQLPLTGILQSDHKQVKFSYVKLACFCVPFSGTLFMVLVLCYRLVLSGSDIFLMALLVFHLCHMFSSVALVYVALKWPQFITKWVETVTTTAGSYNLRRKVYILLTIIMSAGLIDYIFEMVNSAQDTSICYRQFNVSRTEFFYKHIKFPYIFQKNFVDYSLWMSIILHIVDLKSRITWCFVDTFIIIVSASMAVQFATITETLKQQINFNYAEIRGNYNKLCLLCKMLDATINYLLLISYATNLFFILFQLFNSLRFIENPMDKLYYIFSFVSIVFRTVFVSLYASWINEESKKPQIYLYTATSGIYDADVKRFLQQISLDQVYLTGRQYFRVTKGLILSVAGAIVTYELVLIQFNDNLLRSDLRAYQEALSINNSVSFTCSHL